ncbi:response regulator [bacterium]|nr:response regulator [bacterium]
MNVIDVLKDKKILIVDDEPDILETLEELLDMCLIDSAPDFDTAKKFLVKCSYDAAILDIMGVKGYDLLRITVEKKIPTLMLTAHALSPENLIKSIKEGAHAYIPKDKIADIESFLGDLIEAHQREDKKPGQWFVRLRPFFDRHFGLGWREKNKEFWNDFDKKFIVTKEDVERII